MARGFAFFLIRHFCLLLDARTRHFKNGASMSQGNVAKINAQNALVNCVAFLFSTRLRYRSVMIPYEKRHFLNNMVGGGARYEKKKPSLF